MILLFFSEKLKSNFSRFLGYKTFLDVDSYIIACKSDFCLFSTLYKTTNDVNQVSSVQARKVYDVVTHVAPVLPATSGDITVNQGETAVLSCETSAVPQPDVQWTKNGRSIEVLVCKSKLLSDCCVKQS